MTSIQYADYTWNAFVGCKQKSEGCGKCYAQRIADNLSRHKNFKVRSKYAGLTSSGMWNGRVRRADIDKFNEPISIKEPKIIFANSMSDTFFDGVPDRWIFDLLDVIKKADQHIFIILTKYDERMRKFLNSYYAKNPVIKNLCLGVSVEKPKYLSRVENLLKVPAWVRCISVEPYLEKTNFSSYLLSEEFTMSVCRSQKNLAVGHETLSALLELGQAINDNFFKGIDWIIAGGESHPNASLARPSLLEDFQELLTQARSTDTAFFMKQLGANPLYFDDGLGHKVRFDCSDPKGGDFDEFPDELKVREYPNKFHEHFERFKIQKSLF